MKALLLPALLIASTASAQIVLEHTYQNSGFYTTHHDQVFVWPFEASGVKYVQIDRTERSITLYHLDHTFYKEISYAGAPINELSAPAIMYLSEHLFDQDDDVEYLYYASLPHPFTAVYDEDGTALLTADSSSIYVFNTLHAQQYPIMNTPSGARLVVSHEPSMSARVYRLPGTLACFECDGSLSTEMWENTNGMGPDVYFNLFPNPSNEQVTVSYDLPPGTAKADLVITDERGAEIMRQLVFNTAEQTVINTAGLSAGTYFYHLRTNEGIVQAARHLVIR
jgi:hypothetical protein